MTILNKDTAPAILQEIKKDLQKSRKMTYFAKETNISRENMYGVLDNKNKVGYDKFLDILNAAGYEVIIKEKV